MNQIPDATLDLWQKMAKHVESAETCEFLRSAIEATCDEMDYDQPLVSFSTTYDVHGNKTISGMKIERLAPNAPIRRLARVTW